MRATTSRCGPTRGLLPRALLLLLPLLLTHCAVKPPLRYVSPDGELHAAHTSDARRASRRPPAPGAAPRELPPPDAPAEEPAADPVQAHFTDALGLQSGCRWGEALATYRGVVEAQPAGPYAARSLVRMAEIYLEPGYHARDPERARALLQEVQARFPDSAAAAVAGDLLGRL